MKIKIKLSEGVKMPNIIEKGEWIDLSSKNEVVLISPFAHTLNGNRTHRNLEIDSCLIDLGVAMEIPNGYEAILAPRSSTFTKYGIIQTNSIGVIDCSYCSDDDIWKMSVVALRDCCIKPGDRICQFRIQLSQKATIWQKIKWLFTNKIELVQTDHLDNKPRGGFGTTGK